MKRRGAILFNCHYIIKNFEIAQQCEGHSDHIHIDGPPSGPKPEGDDRYTSCNGCKIFSMCEERIYKVFHQDQWMDYDPEKDYTPNQSNKGKGVLKLFRSNGQLKCRTESEWPSLQALD